VSTVPPAAPHLFEVELDVALEQLSLTPTIGWVYEQSGLDAAVRRLLLPRTRSHVYYAIEADGVVVLSIWGGPKGQGPRL
jgi:plasmid stabilization system protein ParE